MLRFCLKIDSIYMFTIDLPHDLVMDMVTHQSDLVKLSGPDQDYCPPHHPSQPPSVFSMLAFKSLNLWNGEENKAHIILT